MKRIREEKKYILLQHTHKVCRALNFNRDMKKTDLHTIEGTLNLNHN